MFTYRTSPAIAKTTQTATLKAVAGACSAVAPPVNAFTGLSPYPPTGLPVAYVSAGLMLEASGVLAPVGATDAGSTGLPESELEPGPDDGPLPAAAATGVEADQSDHVAELGFPLAAAGVA